jgi:nucleoside-diphosphate-sugar epimerase
MKHNKIIVTGGSGYIGTEIINQLVKKKYTVTNIDKKKPKTLNPKVIFYRQNLLSKSGLNKIFKDADVCIHLAAEVGGVAFANKYPAKILKNNTLIDLNTIDTASRAGIKKFIYISSSLVYEKCNKFPLKEEYVEKLPPPELSYGFEKLFGESLCNSYSQQYGMKYAICRLFNAYGCNSEGETDPNGHVIPDLIRKVKNSSGELELLGKKGITRSFTHVNDIANGIISVVENEMNTNETFNIASPIEYTLEQIVQLLWGICRKKEELRLVYLPSFSKDVYRNYASVEKAAKMLGWKATKKMKQGLSEMVNAPSLQ